jgi:hypothetical protein
MQFEERKSVLAEVEALRGGRTLVCFLNFDRQSDPPIPGIQTQFHADVKEALFRILKESPTNKGVDICVYTRGGDTNSVWPLVSLVREFDEDFQVLVPFRCHSSGTLFALGARRIIMSPIAELSPIDPSTGNQFNPRDPANPRTPLAISVEDVRAYKEFISEQLAIAENKSEQGEDTYSEKLSPFLAHLTKEVHPLAIGNVHRVLQQIRQLAAKLLDLHPVANENREKIIEDLTTRFYSHLHMINRHEAKAILGDRVELADGKLSFALDRLLRAYEDRFSLRRTFYLSSHLAGKTETEVRFIGGAAESRSWSYLFETRATVRQATKLPANVQVQIPPGQPMPLVPGLPRETQVEIIAQGWVRNEKPLGVTT